MRELICCGGSRGFGVFLEKVVVFLIVLLGNFLVNNLYMEVYRV